MATNNRFKTFVSDDTKPVSTLTNRFGDFNSISPINISSPIKTAIGGVTTQDVPDASTPNINPVTLIPGPAERINAIGESIHQGSLEPLKKDIAKQAEQGSLSGMVTKDANGKFVVNKEKANQLVNTAVGFIGGPAKEISGALAKTAAEKTGSVVKNVVKDAEIPVIKSNEIPKQVELPTETPKKIELETPKETSQQILDFAKKDLPPEHVDLIEPLDNIVAKTADKSTPIEQRVAWYDYLRTPSKVLDKMGLKNTYKDLMSGYENYTKELPKNIDKITQWSKEVTAPDASERIFRYLDGENVPLDVKETKVAGEIKTWLSDWADRLGMKPDERLSSYITHIFPFGKGGEIPEEIAFLIQKKIPGSVYDPFLLQRQGAEGYIKDTWKALDAYVKRATRKVNMDPALGRLKEESSKLTEASQLNYLNRYVSRINLRPTELDTLIDNGIKQMVGYTFGARPTASMTRFARQMIARAKIGGSITSFAKNLTQGVNTFAELGTKYTTKGYMDLVKHGSKELEENGVLVAPFVEDRTYSAIKKAVEKFDKFLFFNMTASELTNRGAAYYGAKAKGLAEGMTEQQAIQYGKDIASKTQFLFGPLDTPVFMSSDIVKTATQFQSFTIKQLEFIAQMAKNYPTEWPKLLRYLSSSSILFGTIGTAFGMDWPDVFPSLRFGTPPALDLPVRTYKAVTGAPNDYGQIPSLEARIKDVGTALFTDVVPAGAQMKRTFEGLQSVNQGKSTTASGNWQFPIAQTPENYIRGALFGKSSLPEAQEYYDKKSSPKPTGSENRFKQY